MGQISWRVDERLVRAKEWTEQATFGGDDSRLAEAERELDAVAADVALARGRILHARFLGRRFGGEAHPEADPRELELFEEALRLFDELGDSRGQGEALFLIGIFHQVVMEDGEVALPFFDRSVSAASAAGDQMTVSYSLRHLGFAELEAGRLDAAWDRFAESTRLRREAGFLPGVAANLVGMAEIATAKGERDEALRLLDEAIEVGSGCGAARMVELAERTKAEVVAGAG
jgi:tetratricopeptide (TPR) repeat protein